MIGNAKKGDLLVFTGYQSIGSLNPNDVVVMKREILSRFVSLIEVENSKEEVFEIWESELRELTYDEKERRDYGLDNSDVNR